MIVLRPPKRLHRTIRRLAPALALTAATSASPVLAHEDGSVEEVTVVGRAQDLIGLTFSAAEGTIGAEDLAKRPILRAGELMEVVPGVVVTQHSGTGKANQFFLRGFNLDHGTDFAGFLDGVPLNLPTHGHGQGYLDLNPIIPEFVSRIDFGKGPYHAEIGDFSSAGYARYDYMHALETPFATVTIGEYGFYRTVVGGSREMASGTWLAGMEAQYYKGPFDLSEDGHKLNLLLKHSSDGLLRGATFTLYNAQWNATDQVPERAVQQGLIGRYGNIDPTLGGNSTRASLNLEFGRGDTTGQVFAVYSDFRLYSNFTYFLDDPVNGDQIQQQDRRAILGGSIARLGDLSGLGLTGEWEVGGNVRHDEIFEVSLGRSQQRVPLAPVRQDEVSQTSVGVYAMARPELTSWARMELGLRADGYRFAVDALNPANDGTLTDGILSPKAALVLGPFNDVELFLNAGTGFHSNDARGTVTTIDPASGAPATPVSPLVRSHGAEAGLRFRWQDKLNSTVSVWYLGLASELVFIGDAGTTEPAGASRRHGIEWNNFYNVTDWLTLDFDLALTDARFKDVVDDAIPNSVQRVITTGASIDLPNGVFGALRLRHFGDSPLTEDGTVKADPTTVVNLRAGYRASERVSLTLDVFNLFDSTDPDISYFFASCLPSDPPGACAAGGVEDRHVHPLEPRAIRGTLSVTF